MAIQKLLLGKLWLAGGQDKLITVTERREGIERSGGQRELNTLKV